MLLNTKHGKINVLEFPSKKPSKIAVLCIHGFCCDARIFNYLATKLADAGLDVKSIDLFGHGGSDGKKGDPDFIKCLEAINEIVLNLKKEFKVFILSHSIGCTFATWYAHIYKNTIDGLILMSPYVRIKSIKKRSDAEPTTTEFLYLLFRRFFSPSSIVKITDVLDNYVSVGGEEISFMLQDKELNFNYSFRYLIDILAIRNSKVSKLCDINIPTLILHGRKDKNVYPQVGEEYCNLIKSHDKTIKLFDCDHWFYDAIFYHQNSTKYIDESRTEIVNAIKEWVLKKGSAQN